MKTSKANGEDPRAPLATPLMMVPEPQALLTVEEVASLLRVQPSWVYERTRSRAANRIPGFRLGKYWRFREADVLDWLDRQQR